MPTQDLFLPILQIAMIAVRVTTLWMFFPVFGNASIPATIRLAGAIALSVALKPLVGPHLPAWTIAHLPELGEATAFLFREFAFGAGLGLVSRWIFSACVASAYWISMQMGLAAGGMFNPETQTQENGWAEFHQWLAIMMFFSLGGHLLYIQALADSYTLDLSVFFTRLMDPAMGSMFWIEIGTRFFTWMLKLSGPLMVLLLLLQMALGVLSKFVPQINVWSVSMPITIGVGVLVFSLLSPLYGDALTSLLEANFQTNILWLKFAGGR